MEHSKPETDQVGPAYVPLHHKAVQSPWFTFVSFEIRQLSTSSLESTALHIHYSICDTNNNSVLRLEHRLLVIEFLGPTKRPCNYE